MTSDSRTRFGATAQDYVRSRTHATGDDLGVLAELARELRPTVALDIGTGGGHTALAIAPHCDTTIAFDLTRPMLEAARGHIAASGATGVEYVEGEAAHLPFDDGALDFVTCRVAAHHFHDMAGFCRESARVLRPGGTFVLIDNVGHEDPAYDAFLDDVERRRDPSHVRSLSIKAWTLLITEAGPVVRDVQTFRRSHDYEDWTARQRMPDADKTALARDMLAAPAPIRDHYAVAEGGVRGVATFETDFAIIIAEVADGGRRGKGDDR